MDRDDVWVSDALDVLVIGAGFRGLCMLHRLRQLWLRAHVLEVAESVGGTWLYNRCPGARCAGNSWYNGGNVPGRTRMHTGYTGGIPEYRRRCDEVAAGGYTGSS